MSKLVELRIQGIRSYSSEDTEAIKFDPDLTLIIGRNGSGKTTILECIKYLCSGDLPSLTRLGTFVNDLRISNLEKSKAKIELVFIDEKGKKCTVSRSIVSQMKDAKIDSKLSDVGLTIVDKDGRQKEVTRRSIDTIREISTLIGASKSILEYVVMCHHDDSCWPLGEPRLLKDILDEIFVTKNYNKALESLRNVKKQKILLLKQTQDEVLQVEEICKKGEEIENRLSTLQDQYNSSMQDLEQIGKEMEPLKKTYEDTVKQTEESKKLHIEYNNLSLTLTHMQEELSELKRGIVNFDPNLNESQVSSNIIKDETRLTSITAKISQIEFEIGEKLVVKNEVSVNVGRNQFRECLLVDKQREITLDLEKGFSMINRDVKINPNGEKYFDLKNAIEELKGAYDSYDKGVQEKITNFEAEIKSMKGMICKKRMDMDQALSKYHKIEGQLKAKQTEKETLDSKISEMENRISETKSLEESYKKSEDVIVGVVSKLEASKTEFSGHQSYLNGLNDKLTTCNNEIEEQTRFLSKHESELSFYLNDEQKRTKLCELQKELNNIINAEIKLETNLGGFDLSRCESWTELVKMRKSEVETISNLINEKTKFIIQLEKSCEHRQEHIDNINSKISELKNMLKEIEGQMKVLLKEEADVSLENVSDKIKIHKKKCRKNECLDNYYNKFIKQMMDGTKKTQKKGVGCPLCSQEVPKPALSLAIHKAKTAASRYHEKADKWQKMVQYYKYIKSNSEQIAEIFKEIKIKKEQIQVLETEREQAKLGLSSNLDEIKSLSESVTYYLAKKKQHSDALENFITAQRLTSEISTIKSLLQSKENVQPFNDLESIVLSSRDKLMNVKKLKSQFEREISAVNSKISEMNHFITSSTEMMRNFYQKKAEIQSQKSFISELEKQMNENIRLTKSITKVIEKLHKQSCTLKSKIETLREKFNSDNQTLEDMLRSHNDFMNSEAIKTHYFKNTIFPKTDRYLGEHSYNELEKTKLEIIKGSQEDVALGKLIKELEDQKCKLNKEKDHIRCEIASLKLYSGFFEKTAKIKSYIEFAIQIKSKITVAGDYETLKSKVSEIQSKINELRNKESHIIGSLKTLRDHMSQLDSDLNSPLHKNSKLKYKNKVLEVQVLTVSLQDIDSYYEALDYAITKYHFLKIQQVNALINEYWKYTYRSDDISTIEIRSEVDEGEKSGKERRSYNYRIVMMKDGLELDMRGRCSAGQKMMACVVIRLALAEAFCGSCLFLALDEPTTNLDSDNIHGLADSLRNLVTKKRLNGNFQLVIITHDEKFLAEMCHDQLTRNYIEVSKNPNGYSSIKDLPVCSFLN